MECTRIDDLLMDYLYQELAPEQVAEFRAHLETCDRCAREVRELQGVRAAVRELPTLEPPKALTAQLVHQAAEARKPAFPWLRQLWELVQPRRSFYAVAAAASLVVVLFVGYAMRQGRLTPSFPAEERAVAEAPATPASPAAPAPARAPAPAAAPAAAAAPTPGDVTTLARPAEASDQEGKLAAGKSATGYPVRLDSESVQREKTAGDDRWDSNVGRLADAKKGGFGMAGGGAPAADQAGVRTRQGPTDDARPGLATDGRQPGPVQARLPQGLARGAQAAPVLNAPAGGPAGGEPRPALPSPAMPPVQAQRSAPSQAPRTVQAPAEPAPAREEPESGYYRRQGGKYQAPAPQASPVPAAPPPEQRQRGAENALGNRDEGVKEKDKAEGHGFAQAPPDERTRMRASVDYKNAMGVGCEKQLRLLEDFITRYPWDSRVKEAKIRLAVCRARLTGNSEDVDDVLRNIQGERQKKSLGEAEQRAVRDRFPPARRAPSPAAAERQTVLKARKAPAKAAETKPALPKTETVQQAARAKPVAKPVAKAKAPAKPAAPTATAAKGKKAAPAKADAAKAPAKTDAATSK